jgi:hypothetical protein
VSARIPVLSALLAVAALAAGSALRPADAGAAPVLGVNVAGVPGGPEIEEALGSGAKEVRIFLLWKDLEPQARGRIEPNYVKAFTDIVARLSAAGARANFVFTTAPQWASGSANPNTPPRDPQDYADALAAFARSPGIAGNHVAYEVWNEEDAGEWWAPAPDPAAYVKLFGAAARALRTADPTAQVVLGPLTGNDFPFLEKLYDNGVGGLFDAAAVHTDTACLVTGPSTFFRDADKRISQYVFLAVREVLATMRAHGDDKPLRVSEFGWTSTQSASGSGPSCERGAGTGTKPSGVTPADQGTFLAQAYHCLAQEPGIEAATWFTLRDAQPQESPLDELRHYGLLTTGGAHKPAWDAFHQIATAGDTLTGLCGDFDGPEITILTPKVGQSYAGALGMQASAHDAGGPKRITFAADGKNIQHFSDGLANDKPVGMEWQGAKDLSIGVHEIQVTATDMQGNEGRATVQVRKVTPTQLIAIGPAKFTVRGVKCNAKGICTISGSMLSPSGSPLPGRIQLQWQCRAKATKKHKARWVTLHKRTKTARRPFRVSQRLRRSGSWRVRVRYLAPKPLKSSSSPWSYFIYTKTPARKK